MHLSPRPLRHGELVLLNTYATFGGVLFSPPFVCLFVIRISESGVDKTTYSTMRKVVEVRPLPNAVWLMYIGLQRQQVAATADKIDD